MSDICGPCKIDYANRKDYLDHVCKVSGEKPISIEHLKKTTSPNADLISQASLVRGNKRKELEAQGKTREEAIAETRNLKPVVKPVVK